MAGCYWFFFNCYLNSSNKINCISALFFKQIYILSLPIIDEFLWSVDVSTVSPVKLHAEDDLKIQQKKALKSRENTQFSRELLLARCIKKNKLTFMSISPISMRKYVRRRFR